ncbi:DUF397 domain-containing protein [Streptomyces sp. NPDC057245]|uniref:DUF397 domain-containing protein n=1 Tax=Streptomyces sp. NPDC057245 TaxID=3346065 RepID=UPI0036367440
MNIDRGTTGPSPAWFRSSYSNGAGGECVECAVDGDRVLVRDTKIGDALVASVGSTAWLCFTRHIRRSQA